MLERDQQAVELLKLLEDDAAEAVLQHLPEEIAAGVREQMTSSEEELEPQDKKSVIRDFEAFFEFAKRAIEAHLTPAETSDEKAESDLEDEAGSPAPAAPYSKNFRPVSAAMADLESLTIYQLSGALETEQPRTVAILLNSLNPEQSASVLSQLSDEHRAKVVWQLSRDQDAPQVLVDRIARATMDRGKTLPEEAPDRRDQVERLAEVMREVPKQYRRDMLTAIEEEDEETAGALKKHLYRFEDIASMESYAIQQILGDIDATTLTTAMFGASDDIKDAILDNLSRRARQTIEEELAFQTRVPDSRVKEARESVAELIAKTEQEGE